ncbi:hypothetical protein BS78_05G263400 [Paspalum vaginatum]|nr:hypothetical protein BS78_05G263400 [Paspalum vaginatum]
MMGAVAAAAAVAWITEWWIRVVVCFSLGGHVVLALLAGIRRRAGPGVGTGLLWLAYQAVDQAAPFFLSNLSLGSTLREQQLLALWVPSIVAHLAGPDNITAYSLEDNKLSLRLYLSAGLQIIKIGWLMYTQWTIVTSKGALFRASLVMVAVGVWKYGEKVWAFTKADFGNIGSSSKKKQPRRLQFLGLGRRDEQALLLAHQLLNITKAAFADKFYLSKEEEDELKEDPKLKAVFFANRGWKNMCSVVEMELSLMYDILYTKAAVIHNWCGFVVRAVSPVVTATVLVLFWLTGSTDGERTVDVIVTYVLLAVTLLLDVRWLLGAVASTWTYTFFSSTCLHHEVCCSGRWRRLRRFLESLDPSLPLRTHSDGYRLWSGTIGQYNLFHECTRGQGRTTGSLWTWPAKQLKRLCKRLAKMLTLEDALMERRYSCRLNLDGSSSNRNVKKLLFEQIQKAFKMDMPRIAISGPSWTPAVREHQRRRDLDEELDFLPEFQELILIWHVATDVFLSSSHGDGQFTSGNDHRSYVRAIRAVSDYMAFLAAVRPDMLPGLKLRSLHQSTSRALQGLWEEDARRDRERLIPLMEELEGRISDNTHNNNQTRRRSALYDRSPVLSDGIKFGNLLSQKLDLTLSQEAWEKILQGDDQEEGSKSNSRKRFEFLIPDLELPFTAGPLDMEDLLPLLLKSWVRLLIYVSLRCGRDSHVKQLGRGCELTTIVWILSVHAGIFAERERDGRY